jgi:hypothetical protein
MAPGFRALVITGPPGAGKTAVAEALSDLLVRDDVRHALIETEAITATHPPLADERWFEHVRVACALHREAGYELLLVVATVESDVDLRSLVDAIDAAEHAVVRLEAGPATLQARIIAREPAGWSGLDELVAATARLAPVIAGLDGVALALSTDDQRAETVAQQIRDAFPESLRGA